MMKHKIIKLDANDIIGVVGDIHEHESQFDDIINEFKPSKKRLIVSVGDIYDKGFGINKAESITDKLKKLNENGVSHTVIGNHDYKHIRKAKRSSSGMSSQLSWLDFQPWSISFSWPNGKKVLVLHAGVTPRHSISDLNSPEVMYVRTVDVEGKHVPVKREVIDGKVVMVELRPGKEWHEVYDGRFGYICSGHNAQKDGIPKYYKYSCNVDTACFKTGILTCQLFDSKKLLDTIQVQGTASGFEMK